MLLDQHLNPEQIAAVTHGEGPQLVIAGAGSGKTRVITHRIAWLVKECGVEPYRIAAVTFTNKAAAEMRDRVEKLLGGSSEVFVGTFHRFALRLLRRYGDRVGLSRDFSIVDTSDQQALIKRALEAGGLDVSVFSPRAVLSRISGAKNRLLGPADFERQASGFFESGVAVAYREYQRLLRESSGLDFDDMIAHAVRLLSGERELGDRMRRRLRHLLVDEFQDTNFAQLELIHQINGEGGNLTAVGDEDQSIYRWRGAELENVLDFEKVFPGATVRKLERNYRSTQNILDASGDLVANNHKRRGKRLWTDTGPGDPIELFRCRDEGEEARRIAQTLRSLRAEASFRFRQMAILVRTNAQTRAIEDELLRQKVPYCLIAGVRFYERAEIKDLVAYLRLVRNPQDNVAFRRVLNRPPRGIGKATQEMLFREAEDLGQSLWEVLRLDRLGGVSNRGAKALRGFRDLVLEFQAAAKRCGLDEVLELVLERTGYQKLYQRDDDDSQSRRENIQEFLSAAGEFTEDFGPEAVPARLDGEEEDEGAVDLLTSFLDYVALVSDTDGLDTDVGVSLMTLHSAKGLEFPVVFVAGLEDGLLPHFNSQELEQLEEERRLLYVGMTRAEKRLFLLTCSRRRIAGRYQDQRESPFLRELPSELMEVHQSPNYFPSPIAVEHSETAGVRSFFGGSREAAVSPVAHRAAHAAPHRAPVSPASAAVELSPASVPLRRGVGVLHPKLGKGVILEVDGSGENAKLTVYFDHNGKRRLIAKYAGLEPL